MKNVKRKVLSVVLAVSVILSCAPGYSVYASKNDTAKADVTADYISETKDCLWADGASETNSKEDAVRWRQSGRDGKYYLYLPASADLSKLKVWHSFSDDVTVNGKKIESGKETDVFSKAGDYTVQSGENTYIVTVMQAKDCASMFLTTDEHDLDYINSDKGNSDSGNVLITNADGSVDYENSFSKFKGRGNSTWLKDKKPYALNLNKKADLLGMDESKKWVLLSNYNDMSLIHDQVAYDLADEAGLEFSPDSRQVNLYVNGEYQGVYQLCEKVELGKNNLVKVTDLGSATEKANDKDLDSYGQGGTAECVSGTNKYYNIPNNPKDITGGYLLECEIMSRYTEEASGFVTNMGQSIICKSPEYASKEQIDYISSFYQDFEDALLSEDGYNSKGKYYTDYIDIKSFADMYWIQEITKNVDIGLTSLYMYKDSDLTGDGKLHMAAAWDFDASFGIYKDSNNDGSSKTGLLGPDSCILGEGDNFTDKPTIFNALFDHKDYLECVTKEWTDNFYDKCQMLLEDSISGTDRLKSVKQYGESIKSSAEMNFSRWDTLGDNITGIFTGNTYDDNIEFLRDYIKGRTAYLDSVYRDNGGVAPEESKQEDGDKSVKVYFDNSDTNWDDIYVNLYYCYGVLPLNTTKKLQKVEGTDDIYYTEVSTKYDGLFFRTGDWSDQTNVMLKIPLGNKNCYKKYTVEGLPDGGWYNFNGTAPESSKLNLVTKLESWNGGYQINAYVKNYSDKPVDGWSLKVKKNDLNIINYWCVDCKDDGDYMIITPKDWNSHIDPGKSINFGIQGEGQDIGMVNFEYELNEK